MTIRIMMVGAQDATEAQQRDAVRRFTQALEDALGSPELVAAVYGAYVQLRGVYGETPHLESLTDAERTIYEQWQGAETSALAAALGPHRYLEEPQFEITG
jgi:hypothetical protein